MTTPAPEPSEYARVRLAELTTAGYSVEVLAVSVQGALLLLMDNATPVFVANEEDTLRSELAGQTFIVCEHAEQSFQRFLRSHVDENFRLVRLH